MVWMLSNRRPAADIDVSGGAIAKWISELAAREARGLSASGLWAPVIQPDVRSCGSIAMSNVAGTCEDIEEHAFNCVRFVTAFNFGRAASLDISCTRHTLLDANHSTLYCVMCMIRVGASAGAQTPVLSFPFVYKDSGNPLTHWALVNSKGDTFHLIRRANGMHEADKSGGEVEELSDFASHGVADAVPDTQPLTQFDRSMALRVLWAKVPAEQRAAVLCFDDPVIFDRSLSQMQSLLASGVLGGCAKSIRQKLCDGYPLLAALEFHAAKHGEKIIAFTSELTEGSETVWLLLDRYCPKPFSGRRRRRSHCEWAALLDIPARNLERLQRIIAQLLEQRLWDFTEECALQMLALTVRARESLSSLAVQDSGKLQACGVRRRRRKLALDFKGAHNAITSLQDAKAGDEDVVPAIREHENPKEIAIEQPGDAPMSHLRFSGCSAREAQRWKDVGCPSESTVANINNASAAEPDTRLQHVWNEDAQQITIPLGYIKEVGSCVNATNCEDIRAEVDDGIARLETPLEDLSCESCPERSASPRLMLDCATVNRVRWGMHPQGEFSVGEGLELPTLKNSAKLGASLKGSVWEAQTKNEANINNACTEESKSGLQQAWVDDHVQVASKQGLDIPGVSSGDAVCALGMPLEVDNETVAVATCPDEMSSDHCADRSSFQRPTIDRATLLRKRLAMVTRGEFLNSGCGQELTGLELLDGTSLLMMRQSEVLRGSNKQTERSYLRVANMPVLHPLASSCERVSAVLNKDHIESAIEQSVETDDCGPMPVRPPGLVCSLNSIDKLGTRTSERSQVALACDSLRFQPPPGLFDPMRAELVRVLESADVRNPLPGCVDNMSGDRLLQSFAVPEQARLTWLASELMKLRKAAEQAELTLQHECSGFVKGLVQRAYV